MQEGNRDASRVVVSETALSRLPPRETAKVRNAPRLPTDASQFDIHAPGAVTVTLFGLWHRNPESSRTQNRTCIDDGTARMRIATYTNALLTIAMFAGVTSVICGTMMADRTNTNNKTRKSLRIRREKPGGPTGLSK
jgi:hypothetical protein